MEKNKKEKNKKILIVSLVIVVILLISLVIYVSKSSSFSIKKVKKVLDTNYYSITCINTTCNYIEAVKGDKLSKSTTYVLDSNGKKLAKINEKYNPKASTDNIIDSVTKTYIIYRQRNRSTFDISKYLISNNKGKIVYSTVNELSIVNDNLIKEKDKEKSAYKILSYKGKELFTNVNDVEAYNNGKLISIQIGDDYTLLNSNGEKILDGYMISKEITSDEGKVLYLILKDQKGNSFYYYDINKNTIKGDGFQNYKLKTNSKEVEYVIDKNENNSVVRYILKSNGKQVKYESVDDAEFLSNVKSNLDTDVYRLYTESIVNTTQQNVLVDNKNDKSFGVYNIKTKKYTSLYKYKSDSSYNYSTIYKLDNDSEKPYLQINCKSDSCEKSNLYVYDLDNEKILYRLEDDDFVANKYTQYSDNYKVIKYSYSTTNTDYKGKYVLLDKDNKELAKSVNPIVIIDKDYMFGSISTDKNVTLYSVKKNKVLNDESSSASLITIGESKVYKFSDDEFTYILSETGKEIVKIKNSIKLIYSTDTISYIDGNKIYIVNLINNKTKKYTLKDNEKINDNNGDTIPPYKNSVIVNNSSDHYVKIINFNGSTVKKITKQDVYKVKQSDETKNVILITRKTVKNKIYYGLYIAR